MKGLKEIFEGLSDDISEECVIDAAKKCLLPPSEVKIWFDTYYRYKRTEKEGQRKQLPLVVANKNRPEVIKPLLLVAVHVTIKTKNRIAM